ncbi:MAG: MFS transporter [Prevotella sp.]|nr:MFS transporter [Prevotella sp.]
MNLKVRLAVMNFLEFAAWGAYLTCMGVYLGNLGMGAHIGGYFAMQGIVSIFMPALMGIVADRWIPAQRLLGLCHLLAGIFMLASAWYGHVNGTESKYFVLFSLYSVSVAFYMPTLALTNSVAYNALTKAGMDTVKAFPPIRIFGTIGFICTMWFVDLTGFNQTEYQFVTSGVVSLVLFLYSFTLPKCEVNKSEGKKSFSDALGLQAFSLFKRKEMAIFFIFSALLGASLQITNGFATPYIQHFETMAEYAGSFGVEHATILYSISQISETFCILLIPFFMKRYGIKQVMLIAMFAWVLRFGFLGLGNPGAGIWLFILSMIIYGMAFDFFNISGSLYVDKATDPTMRSSAQGLFILMTNGIGATVGSVAAQQVVNVFTHQETMNGAIYTIGNWGATWSAFSVYALIVGVLFALIFHPQKKMK